MNVAATFMQWAVERVGRTGSRTIDSFHSVALLAAGAWAVARHVSRPTTWRRTVRAELVRQIYYSGTATVKLLVLFALFVGLGVFFNLVRVANEFGQVELTRNLFVVSLVVYIGPLLVGLLVVGRSGMAIIAELGVMRMTGQITLLESQGIDPMTYLAVPRVLALAVCVPLLTVVFVTLTLAFGYGGAVAFGVAQQRPLEFSNLVLGQITPAMHLSVLLKTALVGYLVGVTACLTGLRAGTEITEVPKLLPVGFVRCAMVVFVVTAVVSAIV